MLIKIDPRPIEDWCKDTPALMYARYTLRFTLQYMNTVNVYIPEWNENVCKQKFRREENIAEDIDG